MSGSGEVGQPGDPARVARRHRDLQRVLANVVGRSRHRRHTCPCSSGCRGEHVRRRALGDLLRQRRAGAEVERHLRPRVGGLELLAQRVNDSVSDAAANTVTVPDAPARLLPDGETRRTRCRRRTAERKASGRRPRGRRAVAAGLRPPGPRRRHGWTSSTATASTPGSSPSSSAASRLISDTTRNGPACISTWAITPSLMTRVTIPGKRLRADSATTAPGDAATAASVRANAASAAPRSPSGPLVPDVRQPARSRPSDAPCRR